MEFLRKESINSKELLKQINIFREMEYQEKEANNTLTEAQKKRGHYIELRHDNLLKIIRDEFNMKVNAVNKNAVKNNNHYNGPVETIYRDDIDKIWTIAMVDIDTLMTREVEAWTFLSGEQWTKLSKN